MSALVPPPMRLSGVRRDAASVTIEAASCSVEGMWEVIGAPRHPGRREAQSRDHVQKKAPSSADGPGSRLWRVRDDEFASRCQPAFQREHLRRVEQPRRVENGAHAHLLLKVL